MRICISTRSPSASKCTLHSFEKLYLQKLVTSSQFILLGMNAHVFTCFAPERLRQKLGVDKWLFLVQRREREKISTFKGSGSERVGLLTGGLQVGSVYRESWESCISDVCCIHSFQLPEVTFSKTSIFPLILKKKKAAAKDNIANIYVQFVSV